MPISIDHKNGQKEENDNDLRYMVYFVPMFGQKADTDKGLPLVEKWLLFVAWYKFHKVGYFKS